MHKEDIPVKKDRLDPPSLAKEDDEATVSLSVSPFTPRRTALLENDGDDDDVDDDVEDDDDDDDDDGDDDDDRDDNDNDDEEDENKEEPEQKEERKKQENHNHRQLTTNMQQQSSRTNTVMTKSHQASKNPTCSNRCLLLHSIIHSTVRPPTIRISSLRPRLGRRKGVFSALSANKNRDQRKRKGGREHNHQIGPGRNIMR